MCKDNSSKDGVNNNSLFNVPSTKHSAEEQPRPTAKFQLQSPLALVNYKQQSHNQMSDASHDLNNATTSSQMKGAANFKIR